MIRTKIEDYVINIDKSIYELSYKYIKNKSTIYVVDSNYKLIGGVGLKELSMSFFEEDPKISDIINTKCKSIRQNDSIDQMYNEAAAYFIKNDRCQSVPIIDIQGKISDILTRERVFFENYYHTGKLKRCHYAENLWNAAIEASALKINHISAIEFGVAGGNGLVILEEYAREITRLTGVQIDIFGFDTGEGMPTVNEGYKDMLHWWPAGAHGMDRKKLEKKLENAKLIIGDINYTLKSFIQKYHPNPIGAMLVDVDYYSSTKPILAFLGGLEDQFSLPRIYMYFDDADPKYEFSGETLAIKEFNREQENIKISPELTFDKISKNKICHKFLHREYNNRIIDKNKDLRLC